MQFKNNLPFFKDGIELDRVCFSGGRATAKMAKHGGICEIEYFGRQRLHEVGIFKGDTISSWTQLFRLFLIVNDKTYMVEMHDTTLHPYGYESYATHGGVTICHRLNMLNETAVIEAEILSCPEDCNIVLMLTAYENQIKVNKPTRKWSGFLHKEQSNHLEIQVNDDHREEEKTKEITYLTQINSFGFAEVDHARTFIGITSSQKMQMRKTPTAFLKHYLNVGFNEGYTNFIIHFGHEDHSFHSGLNLLKETARIECRKLRDDYAAIQKEQTTIKQSNTTLMSFMNNARGVVESMKVMDIPGGMRASDTHYWIWGWDSMVYSDAFMLSGDHGFVRQMLEFYKQKSHPELGIFHSMKLSGDPKLSMAFAAQTLYCVMLYNYFLFSADETTSRKYYPFAKKLLLRAMEDEVAGTGLLKGVALYPDFPEYLEQDGNDISAFNNSIAYQAVRSMQTLAKKLSFESDIEVFATFANKMKQNFNALLFDEDKGYYYDSVSSEDYTPRTHYPNYAILHLSCFADELIDGKTKKIARFMHENLKTSHGPRLMPTWDSSFMADGNQLGVYMPVTEAFYRLMMQRGGYSDNFPEMVCEEWSLYMISEAFYAEAENIGITRDNPGRKQAFCLNCWYSLFFTYYLGLTFTPDGIHFRQAMAKENVSIDNLILAGNPVSLEYRAQGLSEPSLHINGIKISENLTPYNTLLNT